MYQLNEIFGNPKIELKKQGIYTLLELNTGKFYIGSTRDCFRRRWNMHILELRRNIHHCQHLQNAFNKHGEESFRFAILEFVYVPAYVLDVEQMYIDSSNHDLLYNSYKTAGSPLKYKHNDEVKAKISRIVKGRKLSAELIANLSVVQRLAGLRTDNTSGVKGVHWCKTQQQWISQIHVNKRRFHLGRYNNLEDAIKVRKLAETRYWIDGIDPMLDMKTTNSRNKSGRLGVTFEQRSQKWLCQIRVNKKLKHVGYYLKLEDAIEARNQAELKYYGVMYDKPLYFSIES